MLLGLALLALLGSTAGAGKVTLKSGFQITGTPIKVAGIDIRTSSSLKSEDSPLEPYRPYLLVDDGIRRYFIHRLNLREGLEGIDDFDDTSGFARFELKPLKRRSSQVPTWIGRFVDASEWDEYGHRRVTLRTRSGPEHIQLAITRIDPRFLRIESTSHTWEFAVPPQALPVSLLRSIILNSINPRDPVDRMAVVKFFQQSQQIEGAREELAAIRRDFPEMEARIAETEKLLNEQYGSQALLEIHLRQQSGQHKLARYLAERVLEEELSPATLRQAQEVIDSYQSAYDRARHAQSLLEMLQADVPPEQMQRLMPLRPALLRELTYETLPRLEPFLQAADDAELSSEQKLALAYSAWVLGPANAKTQLNDTIALWDARFLILQYLHPSSDSSDRESVLAQLKLLEGISVPVVAQMIPQLPMPVEFPRESAGKPVEIEVDVKNPDAPPVRYLVVAPPEYNPGRSYPAIVALRAEDRTLEETARFWIGSSELPPRNGYVVIVPEYASPDRGAYDYGDVAHDIVLRALNDARQRLNIDSDRVYLSGHGMGGDAAVDIGLSHPDVWAGVIPFTAQVQHAAAVTFKNAPRLPFYFVGGERDRNTVELNARQFVLRMLRADDLIYCEYKGRGFESFREELPRIFEWMPLYRRTRIDRDFSQAVLRPSDNRFGWLRWEEPPQRMLKPIVWGASRSVPRPMDVSGRVYETRAGLNIRHPGGRTILRLSPEIVSYEDRVRITINGSDRQNDFLTSDLGVLLSDLRERGDRQMLYWTELTF